MPMLTGSNLDSNDKSECKEKVGDMTKIVNGKAATKWKDYIKNAIEKLKGEKSGNHYAGINNKYRQYLYKTYVRNEGANPQYLQYKLNETAYTKSYLKAKNNLGKRRVVFEWVDDSGWSMNRVFYTDDHYSTFYVIGYLDGLGAWQHHLG